MTRGVFLRCGIVGLLLLAGPAAASPERWRAEWPETDFARHTVPLAEIRDVIPRDRIPAIDQPTFVPVDEATSRPETEPVIGVVLNGAARAYPLRILIWHEIVNDVVGGVPIAVSWCPLCNSMVVFDRRLNGRVLDFGVTGKLRHSDLVMYDRQTQSWWQQFTGEAIVGVLTGATLEIVPARLESLARFRARAPDGQVLRPPDPDLRPYGANPYEAYDSSERPFLYRGSLPGNVAPLARLVTVGERAWTLDLVRRKGRIETPEGLVITWEPGQNSALDTAEIAAGQDVGNIVVQRRSAQGLVDVAYGVDFAFAFHAFHPDAAIIADQGSAARQR